MGQRMTHAMTHHQPILPALLLFGYTVMSDLLSVKQFLCDETRDV